MTDKKHAEWNPSIDFLRIASAMLVVVSHYKLIPEDFFLGGVHGVCIFFIVSGYCMGFSVNGRTAAQFCAARLSRLLPALFAAIVITSLVEYLLPNAAPDRGQSIRDSIANMICIPLGNMPCDIFMLARTGNPIAYNYVDGAYWSLLVEFRFYILLAIMFYLLRLSQLKIAVALCALSLFALLPATREYVSKQSDFLMYLPFFAFGISYRLWKIGQARIWLCFLPLLSFLCLCLADTTAISMSLNNENWLPFALCFAIFSAAMSASIPYSNALKIAGAMSYPVYLLHQDIWYVVTEGGFSYDANLSALVAIGILGLAYLIHRYVERPTGSAIKYIKMQRKSSA